MTRDEELDLAYDPQRVTASCTWGFGADVTLWDKYPDLSGVLVSLDLTAEQARVLARTLLESADKADAHDRDYIEAMRNAPPSPPTDPDSDLPF